EIIISGGRRFRCTSPLSRRPGTSETPPCDLAEGRRPHPPAIIIFRKNSRRESAFSPGGGKRVGGAAPPKSNENQRAGNARFLGAVKMMSFSWLRKVFASSALFPFAARDKAGRRARSRKGRRSPGRPVAGHGLSRPLLEQLEDRVVPSTYS